MGRENRVTGYWLLVKDIDHLMRIPAEDVRQVADHLYIGLKDRYKNKATEIREKGQKFTQDFQQSELPTGLVTRSQVSEALSQVQGEPEGQGESTRFAAVARATARELALRDGVHPSEVEHEDLMTEIL